MKNNYINIAKNVIDLEIRGLQKLKNLLIKILLRLFMLLLIASQKLFWLV